MAMRQDVWTIVSWMLMTVGAIHLVSRFLGTAPSASSHTVTQFAGAGFPSNPPDHPARSAVTRPLLGSAFTNPAVQLAALYKQYATDIIKARQVAERFCRETKPCPTCSHVAVCLTGTLESEVLYLRIRSFKPKQVFEMSSAIGYSTLWILMALLDNGDGHLTSIDLVQTQFPAVLPASARERWTFKQGDARESLRQLQGVEFDYVHIDTGHDEPFIKWYTTSILGAFARDNKVVGLSLHDIYSNVGVDENLSKRPDFPSMEGLYCLTWLSYAGVTRNMFTLVPTVNKPLFDAVQAARLAAVGDAKIGGWSGWGGKDYTGTVFLELDRAPQLCTGCLPWS